MKYRRIVDDKPVCFKIILHTQSPQKTAAVTVASLWKEKLRIKFILQNHH